MIVWVYFFNFKVVDTVFVSLFVIYKNLVPFTFVCSCRNITWEIHAYKISVKVQHYISRGEGMSLFQGWISIVCHSCMMFVSYFFLMLFFFFQCHRLDSFPQLEGSPAHKIQAQSLLLEFKYLILALQMEDIVIFLLMYQETAITSPLSFFFSAAA